MGRATIRIYPPSTSRAFAGSHLTLPMIKFPLPAAAASRLKRVVALATVLGLSSSAEWTLIAAVVVVGVLLVGWALLRKRRRGSTEDLFDTSGRPSH
ncbi:MAG: hypothetical protein WCB18_00460 [Thermoplasmata archaeon]